MKQKAVIKVQIDCEKCRTKALKIAAVANGVNSVALEGKDRDHVVVIGDGIDAANLALVFKKKLTNANIVNVQEVKENKNTSVAASAATGPVASAVTLTYSQYLHCPPSTYYYSEYPVYYEKVVYDPYPKSPCSIM